MNPSELLFVIAIGAVVLAIPLVTFVLSIIAYNRSRRVAELSARISRLEAHLLASPIRSTSNTSVLSPVAVPQSPAVQAVAPEVVKTELATVESKTDPVGWETFVGQKAFGWLAVVLFGLSATFFLRYAFQNNWIGPVGRVAIGELVGIALVAAGSWYHRLGLVRFSSMLTAAGIVVLYLATYSAYAFYQLLPQTHAGFFLAVIVFESMIAAVVYRSAPIAMAAVISGLLTPILLSSDHDSYRSFFAYLAILNISTVAASYYRRWPAVPSIAYLGTQGLFWLWYSNQYHPEKFVWVLGFQLLIFAIYLVQTVCAARIRHEKMNDEELVRFVVNALFGFFAIQILIRDDYRAWLGTAAIAMAAIYAIVSRIALKSPAYDKRLLLASLSLALGFVAWAIPLQANAHWVAMGWAVTGAALWWFGLRVSAPALRVIAGVFAVAASVRLLTHDLPLYIREPFVPVFNGIAIPSLCVAGAILFAVAMTNPFLTRLKPSEQTGVAIAGVVGVTLLWLVLSFECYGYFVSQYVYNDDIFVSRWRGQLALTVLWTAFATALIILGFRLDRARLRWLAISLFGVTVIKLFLVDMANVQQLYRILAFFVLAVVLGLVARAYQRFK